MTRATRAAVAALTGAALVSSPANVQAAATAPVAPSCPASGSAPFEVFCIHKLQWICFGDGQEDPVFSFCDISSTGCLF